MMSPPSPSAQKWEYDLVQFDPDDTTDWFDEMNSMGSDGWELVCSNVVDGSEWFYFKRPL